MILVSDLGMEITNVVVNWGIFVSLTSEVLVEVIVIVIVNVSIRYNCWGSPFGYRCRCLQSVITVMDGSDT